MSVFRVKPVGPSNVLSMAQLRTLPLGDQVKTLMKNGKFLLNLLIQPIKTFHVLGSDVLFGHLLQSRSCRLPI